MSKHITIVEDDPDIRALLCRSLDSSGYQVTALDSGAGLAETLGENPTDLFILDIGLPDVDGLTVTQQIRRHSDVGIIIISGRGDLTDRVVGLEIGADDYVTKPFEPREVLARVRSLLRRGQKAAPASVAPDGDCYAFGDWRLLTLSQQLRHAGGNAVALTTGEYRLLETFVTRANRVLSRDQLMDACYGNNSPAFDRCIDVCVGRLRKKLGDNPRDPAMIRTVRNGGYLFAAPVRKCREA